MSKFGKMIAFTHVIKEGSFAGASRILGVSSAAVSKQVSTLEEELGVQLIFRTTRQTSLTDVGRSYFDRCLRIIEEVEAAEDLILQQKEEPSGCLKLLCGRYFGKQFLMPNLNKFISKYPKLSFNIEFNDRMPDLNKEDIDVVVGMSVSGNEELYQRCIGHTRYLFCASPKYLESYGLPRRPKDLLKHRFITHSIRKPVDLLEFRNGETLHIEPYLRFNDSEAILQTVKEGIGVAKTLEYMVEEAILKGELVEVLKGYEKPSQPIYLCYRQGRYVPSKVRYFIDYFVDKMKGKEKSNFLK